MKRIGVSILVLMLCLSAAPTSAQTWGQIRDAAMTLRERGQSQQSYAAVAALRLPRATDLVDQQFLAGFLALRVLGRTDIAIQHFNLMAHATAHLSARDGRDRWRAQAGYWMGRAMQAANRPQEARAFYEAAAAYRDTYYGLLAASTLQLNDTASRVASVAANYPVMRFDWIDPRVAPELVLAIIRTESNFRNGAVSHAGALGKMQLMPSTARAVGRSVGVAQVDMNQVRNNPSYNIALGSRHFGDLLTRYNGSIVLAAAAYNAGSERADDWMRRFGDPRSGAIDPVDWVELIPFRETRHYVQKVVAAYVAYANLTRTSAR